MQDLHAALPENHVVTRLEAEPQAGPTEYKLHLLLRPRKSFTYASTGQRYVGSSGSRSLPGTPRNVADAPISSSPLPAQPGAGRQHRLEQLTTQLLWRLQQSSPYHSSSQNSLVLPSLPEALEELQAPKRPAKLLPGLEESRGALYEIGVADNGFFVGLTKEEMTESLNNLRAMAASLGCSVRVLRMVPVGDCEWYEECADAPDQRGRQHKEKLFVAEAYVKPELEASNTSKNTRATCVTSKAADIDSLAKPVPSDVTPQNRREQLRVSLTGASTSGKSSLLGTLSTSTLDNGRGKSRLSLLKHRHEIASGMTSSVAQELIGYTERRVEGLDDCVEVVNYATGNVSSWNDIHASSENGRLAFVSDSAGHPRYRRTTVRGLVGWAPHWTFLCVAANGGPERTSSSHDSTPGSDVDESVGGDIDLSLAHLSLCFKLGLPLVVVMTKLDMATKTTFRQILSTVLSRLKEAGKKPLMLSNDNSEISEADLGVISPSCIAEVKKAALSLEQSPLDVVPVVLTSAVKGNGIGKLHALLRHLPLNSRISVEGLEGGQLGAKPGFLVDDIYTRPLAKLADVQIGEVSQRHGTIVSGHLASRRLSVGDVMYLGPFAKSVTKVTTEAPLSVPIGGTQGPFLSPRTFDAALAKATSTTHDDILAYEEWKRVTVISARNLRLPVKTVEADQVATLGIVFAEAVPQDELYMVRRGMVLVRDCAQAAHTFTASFSMDDAKSVFVGTLVIAYCGTVRASAKVIAVALEESRGTSGDESEGGDSSASEDELFFTMDGNPENKQMRGRAKNILVTFKLVKHREWLEVGSQILVMPASGPGFTIKGSGEKMRMESELEGLVGRITETFR